MKLVTVLIVGAMFAGIGWGALHQLDRYAVENQEMYRYR